MMIKHEMWSWTFTSQIPPTNARTTIKEHTGSPVSIRDPLWVLETHSEYQQRIPKDFLFHAFSPLLYFRPCRLTDPCTDYARSFSIVMFALTLSVLAPPLQRFTICERPIRVKAISRYQRIALDNVKRVRESAWLIPCLSGWLANGISPPKLDSKSISHQSISQLPRDNYSPLSY